MAVKRIIMNTHHPDERQSTYVDSLRFGATMAAPTKELRMNDEYAFPRSANCQFHVELGMSLRDYFAAKAMQSIIAKSQFETASVRNAKSKAELTSTGAYLYADAMLESRK